MPPITENEDRYARLAAALGNGFSENRSFDEMCEQVKDLVAFRESGGFNDSDKSRNDRIALAFELGFGHQDVGMDMIKEKIREIARERDHNRKKEFTKYPTDAARRIFENIFPQWSVEFLAKNAHYADTYEILGTAGQFADIWRKVGPLKRLLWDKKDEDWSNETGETPGEICRDLIGHLFLTLALLEEDNVG